MSMFSGVEVGGSVGMSVRIGARLGLSLGLGLGSGVGVGVIQVQSRGWMLLVMWPEARTFLCTQIHHMGTRATKT